MTQVPLLVSTQLAELLVSIDHRSPVKGHTGGFGGGGEGNGGSEGGVMGGEGGDGGLCGGAGGAGGVTGGRGGNGGGGEVLPVPQIDQPVCPLERETELSEDHVHVAPCKRSTEDGPENPLY